MGFLLLVFGLSGFGHASELASTDIKNGWMVRGIHVTDHPEVEKWLSASVPGVVQTDLQHAGIIPDPFVSDNEKKIQWIGRSDWEYRTEVVATPEILQHKHVELVFDGLNTFADVSLNEKPVLHADNMFRRWTVDVRRILKPGKNLLRVVFHSPYSVMTSAVAQLPYILPGTGYEPYDREKGIFPISHYMRTAPYQYGWDWGPVLVTEGIWRGVRLETWDDARIDNFYVDQQSIRKSAATLVAKAEVKASQAMTASAVLKYAAPDGQQRSVQIDDLHLDAGSNQVQVPLQILSPKLWYPAGYGPQDRYSFSLEILCSSERIAHSEVKTGLRSVELRRQPDQWGKSFEFVVNGIPVFIKGANVVPFDSFPSAVTEQRHRQFLESAREANMNMLRAWGGAYYESDDFYEICDELGLMVWQDFMFGGAMVPGDSHFQENVRQEAIEQVRRLQAHPSVVFWCGNNEVETAWDSWGDRLVFKKSITPDQRERVWQDYVVLFRDVLKGVVAEYGNHVPYWPSSPGADFEEKAGSSDNGDVHFWSVWSGSAPITDYLKQTPRFMSEYGFQAMPDMRTIHYFAGSDTGNFDSAAMKDHQRFINGNDRIRQYMAQEYRMPKDFASFVYLSQVMQAEAINLAAEHLRTLRPRTMGSIYWQLNDCWPAISWASIDYFGRWKALNYYARRFYAPVLVVPAETNNQIEVYVVSDRQAPFHASVTLTVMDFKGAVLSRKSEVKEIAPLASSIALTASLPGALKNADPKKVFLVAEVSGKEGVISRNLLFLGKMKDFDLPHPGIRHEIVRAGKGYALHLRSDVLAKDVAVSFGGLDTKLSDNYFDLLPGQEYTIRIESAASLDAIKKELRLTTMAEAAS